MRTYERYKFIVTEPHPALTEGFVFRGATDNFHFRVFALSESGKAGEVHMYRGKRDAPHGILDLPICLVDYLGTEVSYERDYGNLDIRGEADPG